MDVTLVDELCRQHGIAPEYTDIWGNTHTVSVESRCALLRAMGVDTESTQAMRAASAQVERAAWSRATPPVKVVREAEPVGIELVLPVAKLAEQWRWVLLEEGGAHAHGLVDATALDVVEQREVDGELRQRAVFTLPATPPTGYHGFEIEGPDGVSATSLIVAPNSCYRPPAVSGNGRTWGLGVQLFSVRSSRNWGIGDFTDVCGVVEFAAREGAGLVGVSPLHALFPYAPERASPYGPSNRLFRNVLFVDVEAVPERAECAEARERIAAAAFQAELAELRAAELVDYTRVAALKLGVLEQLYAHFREQHLDAGTGRGDEFRAFQSQQGPQLRRHALFEALQERFVRDDDSVWGWPAWPAAYRDPESAAVADFASAHAARVEFFEYLQWQAEQQLEAAGRRALERGLGIGLYEDLAVGVDVGGSEAWGNQDVYALGARIGAPPDDFNLRGQDWGLPPWMPGRLGEAGYAPFITTLRRNMRAAGALRIDHIMALSRLFWIPSGGAPSDGTYVSYPFEDLLGILALESRRNRCLVIGEDLGTVPDHVRSALAAIGVLSYRLLYFEKHGDGAFRSSGEYPAEALVAVGTHDLPTLSGFWAGDDLDWRRRLGLYPLPGEHDDHAARRAHARLELARSLAREQLLPGDIDVDALARGPMTSELAAAVHAYLARTPARVLLVQLEDVLGRLEQTNLPGTVDAHPNWRRKLELELERWIEEPRIRIVLDRVRAARGA